MWEEKKCGGGRPGGSTGAEATEGWGGAEGCGELPAAGGGRGQLPELGSVVGLVRRQEPRVAPTRDITLTRREASHSETTERLQKSGLQTAETSAGSRPHRLPPPQSVKGEINETNYHVAVTTVLSEGLVCVNITIHMVDKWK